MEAGHSAYMAPWYPTLTLLAFVWGACVGSFLNVCIYRIPRNLSVVHPRSRCPECAVPIAWYHNIPVLSYCILRGRCAACGARFTARYAIVELLTGALFLLIWFKLAAPEAPAVPGLARVGDWRLVPVYWLFVSALVLGTFVDLEHMIIPDRVSLGGIAAGLALSAVVPSMHGRTAWQDGLLASALGAGVGWALLWAVSVLGKAVFRKDAMGFGDVKLMGAIGAFLGWPAVLFTLFASSLLGSLVGLALIVFGSKRMQSRIPYGPYLALGAVLWLFWGPALVFAYIRLLH
jgi:leader peptidase (prepilin peptidase) / N-methyltransferase